MYYTSAEIRSHLLADDRWLLRGLLAIYSRQTIAEQRRQETVERNGIGFNAFDASFLTDIAQKLSRSGHLSDKQIAACRRSMLKYAGQLTRIANGEA
jgi:hypothetical protein